MREDLLEAILAGTAWTDRFTRKGYAEAFAVYLARFGPAYARAVREERPERLAEELLAAVEERTARQKPWDRGLFRLNAKLTAVQYLSPMLLELEEPGCRALAELLCRGWAARWPKEAYDITTYRRIKKGFRNVIMGIEIGRSPGDEEEED